MRAIWSGSLSFGLVNIPVKLYSGTTEQGVEFSLLHQKDFSSIRYARICKAEEKEVPYEEIVKGYEYAKGHYVVLSEEDFEKANIRVTHAIVILDFVGEREVDPIYFEKPYFLEPDKGAAHSYALFRDALIQSDKIGIGKFVLRNREHLIAIRPEGDGLVLEQLRFQSEIRSLTDLDLPVKEMIDEREIKMALALIGQLSKPFNPADYKDTYITELKRVIAEKVAGKVPAAKGTPPIPTRVPDLMETLRKSLEAEKQKTGSK